MMDLKIIEIGLIVVLIVIESFNRFGGNRGPVKPLAFLPLLLLIILLLLSLPAY